MFVYCTFFVMTLRGMMMVWLVIQWALDKASSVVWLLLCRDPGWWWSKLYVQRVFYAHNAFWGWNAFYAHNAFNVRNAFYARNVFYTRNASTYIVLKLYSDPHCSFSMSGRPMSGRSMSPGGQCLFSRGGQCRGGQCRGGQCHSTKIYTSNALWYQNKKCDMC